MVVNLPIDIQKAHSNLMLLDGRFHHLYMKAITLPQGLKHGEIQAVSYTFLNRACSAGLAGIGARR